MVARQQISNIGKTIAIKFKPERIVLFGSYAYGNPTSDSDIDLFVVLPHEGLAARKAAEIRLALPADLSIDVIVRSPEKVQERLQMHDYFISEIMGKGHVIYAGSNGRVD